MQGNRGPAACGDGGRHPGPSQPCSDLGASALCTWQARKQRFGQRVTDCSSQQFVGAQARVEPVAVRSRPLLRPPGGRGEKTSAVPPRSWPLHRGRASLSCNLCKAVGSFQQEGDPRKDGALCPRTVSPGLLLKRYKCVHQCKPEARLRTAAGPSDQEFLRDFQAVASLRPRDYRQEGTGDGKVGGD